MKIQIKELHQHDWNKDVFENIPDEMFGELKKDIKERGLQLPIHITPDKQIGRHAPYTIINGHQRFRAVKDLREEDIECIIRHDLKTEEKIDEQFIQDNVLRRHLNELQIANASDKLMELERRKAEERISLGGGDKKSGQAILPYPIVNPGQSRDKVANMFGISGRTLDKYRKIRDELDKPKNEKLREKLVKREVTTSQVWAKLNPKIKDPSLPFRLQHKALIEEHQKIQTTRIRLDPEIKEGKLIMANIFEPEFAKLMIKTIHKKKLRDFTEEDAKREGGYTLDQFKAVWEHIHGQWIPSQEVYVIQFDVVK